jgi:hypothetical protein
MSSRLLTKNIAGKEHEVQIMENGGNAKVNAVFEAHLHHASAAKPNNTANGQQRERYIRDKYERRKFYDPSAFEKYQAEDNDDEEEEIAMPLRRPTKAVAPVPISRAPSDAARRRAESRQARVAAGGSTLPVDRPSRINVAAPAVDLLDFGSLSSPAPPSAPPPAAPAPPPPQANETLDLFANMTVSTPAPPAQKSNDDILSLFATSNTNTTMMPNNVSMAGGQQAQGHMMMGSAQPQGHMMMGGVQVQGHMMMGNGGQSFGQMNPQMIQQPQMVMHQQMAMMQHQGQNPNHMQGMPQQQLMMNNNMGAQQYMNPMMMQHNSMQGMMSNGGGMHGMQPQQQQQTGPTMMMQMMPAHQQQQQHMNDGVGFGMGAPMGSGPSISSLQGHAQKEDPFAQFGFNAFR